MKKILLLLIIVCTLIFTACTNDKIEDIDDERIPKFDIHKSDEVDETDETGEADKEPQVNILLNDKFAEIDFYLVSGVYSRNVLQDEVKMLEMFALDKDSFVRIASSDMEQEVYAYNYTSDDFIYMYYFDGELLSKTVINVSTGAVLQDEEGYAELLVSDADDLKAYFIQLIYLGNISLPDLLG